MHASQIATGAPPWVYALLVVLIVLGLRRVRTREVPVAVALIPAAAFLIWSLFGAWSFGTVAGGGIALLTWLAGVAVGAATGMLLPEPRGQRLPGGRVRLPSTSPAEPGPRLCRNRRSWQRQSGWQ
jgi:membrane associated rhomboid family serine protease